MNLSKVKLDVWAIETSPVHQFEATDLGVKEWTLEKAKAGEFFSQCDLPLVVHSATEMPKDGAWRETGLDRDVFPFLNRWYDVNHSTHTELGWTAEDKKALSRLVQARTIPLARSHLLHAHRHRHRSEDLY